MMQLRRVHQREVELRVRGHNGSFILIFGARQDVSDGNFQQGVVRDIELTELN